jgi:hypothetical protein
MSSSFDGAATMRVKYPPARIDNRVLDAYPSGLQVICLESLERGEAHVFRGHALGAFGESDREQGDLEWDDLDDGDHGNSNFGSHVTNVATLHLSG